MGGVKTDVAVVGAGHNGLVAATLLARAGLKVCVLEEKNVLGGATRTEYPFAKAPGLGASTASYLLGLVPPEILAATGARIRTIRRDPHYFLPTTGRKYLLFGSDREATRRQFESYFSANDWRAERTMREEIAQIRDDLAPSWLAEPLSREETAERYVRPRLRSAFLDLVTRPVEDYLARFSFESDLVVAMYAVTDGFSGLDGSFGTPGTGLNFLIHNMCRLPGSDGTFMMVEGGMGAVAAAFAWTAQNAGAEIRLESGVEKIRVGRKRVETLVLSSGEEIRAATVLCNADPFRTREFVGAENFPPAFNRKLDGMKRYGTTMKVNLALDRLPDFTCLPENRGQYNGTIHLLPQGGDVIAKIRHAYETTRAGRLAEFPTIEWYFHTVVDPYLRDSRGHHNAAFFVQWVPYELSESSWEAEEERYVDHLFAIAEEFAPGFTDSVVDVFTLTPKKIESHLGIRFGHIHHVDNTIGFDHRFPYRLPVDGLYSCSAGCHPAGAVIGAAGHNAAHRILADLA